MKGILTSDSVLVHYDPSKPLLLACDASPYGVGAVLSHKLADGSERTVAYASRSLGPAEKKYSQLDIEGLAINFGVKRFHQYIVGRHFTILSDHKPLQHLFQETTGVPVLASGHIQRWALTLGAYDYSIRYKPGLDHANADVFSRYSADYDEWKMRDEVIVSASPTLDRPDFHPITELACLIKKRLLLSRHQESAVSVLVPSTKDGFAEQGQFAISGYSDLNDLFGEGWHYRITNRIGDFSYVIPATVAFWETRPHPLKEYRAVKNRDGSITFEPLFIEQSRNIVFKFVRGDGNKAKLLEFI